MTPTELAALEAQFADDAWGLHEALLAALEAARGEGRVAVLRRLARSVVALGLEAERAESHLLEAFLLSHDPADLDEIERLYGVQDDTPRLSIFRGRRRIFEASVGDERAVLVALARSLESDPQAALAAYRAILARDPGNAEAAAAVARLAAET